MTTTEVDLAMRRVRAAYGADAIRRIGDAPDPVPHIPTGIPSVDAALGVGGIVRGRVIEVFGAVGAGKTSLALHLIARAQASGLVVALIDTVHELVPRRATNSGVDLATLLVSQPDSGEQALEIVDALARSGAVDLIVIDDSLALTPRGVIEGEYAGDQDLGIRSRLLSQAMRKITASAARTGSTVVFISTTVPKIGVTFSDPTTTPGCQALKFYSSVRIKVTRGRTLHSVVTPGVVAGQGVTIHVVKNKVAPPFTCAKPLLVFGHGMADVCACAEPPEPPGVVLFCSSCGQLRDEWAGAREP